MNPSKTLFPPSGSVMTDGGLSKTPSTTSKIGAARKGKFQTIEQRRRQGYMRLARTVWVSWLNCHQANIEAQ